VPCGLAELKRVARRRVVVVTIDPSAETDMWLVADYAPEFLERDRIEKPTIGDVVATLGNATVDPVPVVVLLVRSR